MAACGCKQSKWKGRTLTWRDQIYLTLDDANYSAPAKGYAIGMATLIVLATACLMLETEATPTLMEPGFLARVDGAHAAFGTAEFVMVIVFTADYVARLATCPYDKKRGCGRGTCDFICSPFNIIDAFSCLPYWITKAAGFKASFGAVRIVRLLRVFRIVKMGRYSSAIKMVLGALARSRSSLGTMCSLLVIAAILVSVVLNFLESQADEETLAAGGMDPMTHSRCFGTVLRCLWWATFALTSISTSYGSCQPVNPFSLVLTAGTLLGGVIALALPITVIGANYQAMVELHEADERSRREAMGNDPNGVRDTARTSASCLGLYQTSTRPCPPCPPF